MEATDLLIEDVDVRTNGEVWILIRTSKTDKKSEGHKFCVPFVGGVPIRAYLAMLPFTSGRLWRQFKHGKFIMTPVGRNTLSNIAG